MFGSMRVTASMLTDQGRVREHNEDFIDCREPESQEDRDKNGWLYILADGVGGADAGEVASQYATERTIVHYFANGQENNWGRRLRRAMLTANTELRQLSMKGDEKKRMATTMVATVFHDSRATIANVGDSRGYHWRDGRLQQITKDQSLVARLVEEGAITEEEALNHPRKNVILHSIGSENSPDIDLYEIEVIPGDQLILCSDGLTRHVTDEEISNAVDNLNPELATQHLVGLANDRGGEDNISVAVLQIGEQPADVESDIASLAISNDEPLDRMVQSQSKFWIYVTILVFIQIILIILVRNLVNS
jgi:protein phosphatase